MKGKERIIVLVNDSLNGVMGLRPLDVSALRKQYGLEGYFVIGTVGSINWNEKYNICYGWDIIEVVRYLLEYPIKGIIVGDGNGIPRLKSIVDKYDLNDRILFTGHVSHEEVPIYINLMDICFSTQSSDIVGECRTTAKLPEYMACGRYIIATRVGEAAKIVPQCGKCLSYNGIKDDTYPKRVASIIEEILNEDMEELQRGAAGIDIAKRYDYKVLSRKLDNTFKTILQDQKLDM